MSKVTLTFNPPSPPPDADLDVLASVLRDDGSIEVWEANFDGTTWWSAPHEARATGPGALTTEAHGVGRIGLK